MDQNHSWIAGVLPALAAAVLLVGCQTTARDIGESESGMAPCAERLHNISGCLLMYYARNKRLPRTLDDLRAEADPALLPPLVCPVSGKPYIYRPVGMPLQGQAGRLVLYDAVPIHSGMRWGVIVTEPKGDGPLAARVVLLSEQLIDAAESQGGP